MARRRLPNGRAPRGLDESTASSELWTDSGAESDDPFEAREVDEVSLEVNAFDDPTFHDAIAPLYAENSEALARWKDRLGHYVDSQGTLDALRLRPMSEQPWPAVNNPMLGYLVERGIEIAEDKGL